MNADGTGVTQVTRSKADDWHPTWSPDGTAIAFASDRGGSAEVYARSNDGLHCVRLTHGAGWLCDPDWWCPR
jgi:TolB protein